jgi:hypothetical protein
MNKLISHLSALDWLVSGSTLAFGIYQQNLLLIGLGVLGLLLAWYKPAARFKSHLEKKFLRKKVAQSDTGAILAEDAFYSEVLGAETAPDAILARGSETPTNFRGTLQPGTLYFSSHRHNLVHNRHMNLATPPAPRDWA